MIFFREISLKKRKVKADGCGLINGLTLGTVKNAKVRVAEGCGFEKDAGKERKKRVNEKVCSWGKK